MSPGARSGPLFTFRLIPFISSMLARRQIDASKLLEEAGLPLGAMAGEVTAPLARIQHFLDLCAKRLDTRVFGIDLSRELPGGVYGVLEFLVRSAATVEQGLHLLCEFGGLVNPSGQFRFVRGPAGEGLLQYSLGAERDGVGMHLNEMTIAYIVRQFRSVVESMRLESVWFAHTRRDGQQLVGEHFGCPVAFGRENCGFAIPRDTLSLQPRTADPLLFQFMHEQARAQLSRLGTADVVSQLVRSLEARLGSADLGVVAAAKAIGMTSRSLQRHLGGAGTSYKAVLAHVRERRRAELEGGGHAEKEIAFQLGFSDVRAMRRSMTK